MSLNPDAQWWWEFGRQIFYNFEKKNKCDLFWNANGTSLKTFFLLERFWKKILRRKRKNNLGRCLIVTLMKDVWDEKQICASQSILIIHCWRNTHEISILRYIIFIRRWRFHTMRLNIFIPCVIVFHASDSYFMRYAREIKFPKPIGPCIANRTLLWYMTLPHTMDVRILRNYVALRLQLPEK